MLQTSTPPNLWLAGRTKGSGPSGFFVADGRRSAAAIRLQAARRRRGRGRRLSEDPIGYSAGYPNLYRYVGNLPGAFVDPSGLDGAGSAGMLGMAENYAQKGPTPVDAFIGSLASQARTFGERRTGVGPPFAPPGNAVNDL